MYLIPDHDAVFTIRAVEEPAMHLTVTTAVGTLVVKRKLAFENGHFIKLIGATALAMAQKPVSLSQVIYPSMRQ